jgi:hypothetical protein
MSGAPVLESAITPLDRGCQPGFVKARRQARRAAAARLRPTANLVLFTCAGEPLRGGELPVAVQREGMCRRPHELDARQGRDPSDPALRMRRSPRPDMRRTASPFYRRLSTACTRQSGSNLPATARPSSMTGPATSGSGLWGGRTCAFRAKRASQGLPARYRGAREAGLTKAVRSAPLLIGHPVVASTAVGRGAVNRVPLRLDHLRSHEAQGRLPSSGRTRKRRHRAWRRGFSL